MLQYTVLALVLYFPVRAVFPLPSAQLHFNNSPFCLLRSAHSLPPCKPADSAYGPFTGFANSRPNVLYAPHGNNLLPNKSIILPNYINRSEQRGMPHTSMANRNALPNKWLSCPSMFNWVCGKNKNQSDPSTNPINNLVSNTVNKAVNNAVKNAVENAINNPVHSPINNLVHNAVEHAVNNAVNHVVENAVNNAINNPGNLQPAQNLASSSATSQCVAQYVSDGSDCLYQAPNTQNMQQNTVNPAIGLMAQPGKLIASRPVEPVTISQAQQAYYTPVPNETQPISSMVPEQNEQPNKPETTTNTAAAPSVNVPSQQQNGPMFLNVPANTQVRLTSPNQPADELYVYQAQPQPVVVPQQSINECDVIS